MIANKTPKSKKKQNYSIPKVLDAQQIRFDISIALIMFTPEQRCTFLSQIETVLVVVAKVPPRTAHSAPSCSASFPVTDGKNALASPTLTNAVQNHQITHLQLFFVFLRNSQYIGDIITKAKIA